MPLLPSPLFQFQNGTIKSRRYFESSQALAYMRCFNSKMVQLKVEYGR